MVPSVVARPECRHPSFQNFQWRRKGPGEEKGTHSDHCSLAQLKNSNTFYCNQLSEVHHARPDALHEGSDVVCQGTCEHLAIWAAHILGGIDQALKKRQNKNNSSSLNVQGVNLTSL